jgi:Transposase DDE domain
MPYKFNATRRHKIPKARYRVTNWPEYDAALMRRGDLTVWFTEEAVAAWHAPATGERGGQPVYSSLAIETALALRLVFRQPLRQTEGMLRSIAEALKVEIAIPDHTTLSRRGAGVTILPRLAQRDEPLHLLVDSTGLKTTIGRHLHARILLDQRTEAKIACNIVNRMTCLGMPVTIRVA